MNFKEMVKVDIDSVLMNLEEFGEEHEIDGRKVICTVDSDNLREKQGGASKAIAEADKMIFVSTNDVQLKGSGDTLMLDGVPYIVQTWDEDMGITAITLTFSFNV